VLGSIYFTRDKVADFPIPGHNYEVTCKPTARNNKHRVALYHKGDLQSIKGDLSILCYNFLNSDPNSRSVDQLWKEFKEAVNKAVTDHV